MNDKIARQVEEMKKQTIGVELEMSNITRQKTAQVVARYFGTENTVSYDGTATMFGAAKTGRAALGRP